MRARRSESCVCEVEKPKRYSVDIRFVHISRCNRSSFVTLVHKGHHFVITTYDQLGQVFHIRTQTRMFSNSEITSIFGIEKITNFLIVNLEEGINRKREAIARRRTSMYETSITKLRLESRVFRSSHCRKSSEQVNGMIPLSAPSDHNLGYTFRYHNRSSDVHPIILCKLYKRTSDQIHQHTTHL